jgi:DNA-binding PadR family transcriptional regulator
MARKRQGDLSHEDIKFLKAIQELENNPEEHSETGLTDKPANTSSLRAILDMSRQQVTYRMRPDERGLEKMGLVNLFDSETSESGQMLPRSIELTDAGRQRIQDWEEKYGELNVRAGDVPSLKEVERELDEIQSRLDEIDSASAGGDGDGEEFNEEIAKLSSRVDAVSDQVQDFQDSTHGALDEKFGKQVAQALDFVVGYHKIFEALGVPKPKKAYTEDFDPEETRREVRETLGVSGNGEGPSSDTQAEHEGGVDERGPPSDDNPFDR